MYPEQQQIDTIPQVILPNEVKIEMDKNESIGNSTVGRRKNRNSNYSHQTKGTHQSNHLHNSSHDNQSNLNHTFHRNSRFRSKAIRKNQRTHENGLFNNHCPYLITFDSRPYYAKQFEAKIDQTYDKQVFTQFDSGTIDQNLIDRILKDKQQFVNRQVSKQAEKRVNGNQFDKMMKTNGDLHADQENIPGLINEIYLHKHQQIDGYQINLQNQMHNSMMNHPTGQLCHQLNDQVNDRMNGKIDSHKPLTKSSQDILVNTTQIVPPVVSLSNNLPLSKHVSNSSLNKSNSTTLNGSTNSSINLPNGSLNKSLNISHSKQLTNNGLIHKSPAGPGQQLINGFCMANDLIRNSQKFNKDLINSNLIGDQLMNNGNNMQTNLNIINCLIGNSNATPNLNSKSSLGSNSSSNTMLSPNLGVSNSKTNQLYKILPNAISEFNNNDNFDGTFNKFNQQVNHQIDSQICQTLNNQQVDSSFKNPIQTDRLSDQFVSSEHGELESEQTLVTKLGDVLIDDKNELKKNFKIESGDVLKSDSKSDSKGEQKNEVKIGKKNKRTANDNQFKNQPNTGKVNNHLNTPLNNSQMNNSFNQQANQQQPNRLVNNQSVSNNQQSIFNQNCRVISSTAPKHIKPEIKSIELERYSYEKKPSYHHYPNHHPFFKPPRYQDKIMTPDSYNYDHKEHNWKQRKGNHNRPHCDRKQFHSAKSNNLHFVPSVSIPHYPKLIHSYHDIVSNQIWKLYILLRQTPESYERKIEIRQSLYGALKKDLNHDLYMVGSSLNGLGTITSDVDMCLLLPQNLGDIDQSTQAIPILKIVMDIIALKLDYVDNIRLIEAKVPILKFSDKKGNIDIDLNINNIVGIRNTHLVKCYTRLDWRVTPLAIAIKAWAHFNQINNAHKKTLSSYTFVLMLIHYLQVDCSPPILPCLHSLMPNSFRTDSNVKDLNLFEELPEFRSDNKQSLSELFVGFLDYFGNRFDYASDVISIRTGRIMKKEVAREYRSPKNTSTQWHFICCEEPFDRTNTARSVSDYESFKRVTKCFQNSYCRIKSTHNLVAILNLEHLFGLNGLNSGLSNGNLSDLASSKTSNQSGNAK